MTKAGVRGIDHVGIYVPDIAAATQFFIEAFGATFMYESLSTADPPLDLEKEGLVEKVGVAPHSIVRSQRFLTLGKGPDLELFEIHAPGQTSMTGRSDFGLNHFAVYVDDMDAAIGRFERAGGKIGLRPSSIPFAPEAGEGNLFCFGVTPWGMNVEFITYPGEMQYETMTPLRRWNSAS